MPSQQAIQDTILSAQYKLAILVQDNYDLINSGNPQQNYPLINYLRLNITGLSYQLNRPDYTSSTTLTIYDRLNQIIGFDTTINSLDPNAQIPNTIIQIINPAGYTAPIDFSWADFEVTPSDDGGITRRLYLNDNWFGLNPFMELISPAGTALVLGLDYSIVSEGGILILDSSIVLPGIGSGAGIVEGQFLRAYSYALA